MHFGIVTHIKDLRSTSAKISCQFNCQAQVQVSNPLSQQAPNPDSKVRPSLKNPKTQFFGLGLTQ